MFRCLFSPPSSPAELLVKVVMPSTLTSEAETNIAPEWEKNIKSDDFNHHFTHAYAGRQNRYSAYLNVANTQVKTKAIIAVTHKTYLRANSDLEFSLSFVVRAPIKEKIK